MDFSVTVCIATFGSREWEERGWNLAFKTDAKNILVNHGKTLAESRNELIHSVSTEYIVFLDADDELESGYLEAMAKGNADVRVPMVRYVKNGVRQFASFPRVARCLHEGACGPACLPLGNYVVIGAAARTDALRAVGGFRDWAIYEDWDLWLRMHLNGSTFENISDAIYQANVNWNSRNRNPNARFKNHIHNAISHSNGFDRHGRRIFDDAS